jgi:ATP-dependent helicase HrpA
VVRGSAVSRTRDRGQAASRHADRLAARTTAHAELLARGAITFDEALPISARHDELAATIAAHQVVIVAGETGSGKSTQLPKLCLELGRGVAGLIGHTQPRRVAARTIADRVASELGSTVGDVVGSTVRFNDTVGERTLVKVMTDGILLAEIQRDRDLRNYDTIIVDEAHERSLNVDFLLGYLHRLLPRRPDLKLIITSATIDTERFSQHFAGPSGPAPIIEVSGRTFPVDVRYRPLGGDDDGRRDEVERGTSIDPIQGICEGVVELAAEGPGDILVFLSGEREIHDAADAIRELDLPDVTPMPLYARLSWAEQQRIFQPHRGRRVVLATNVAETSITVPGVRYVIDAGTARISRYSTRLKVQRLPIEAISQASANQRAGRCGRVGPGICIRLYAEDDFAARPAFTDPEILRTNLAAVILQMTALGLGDVAAFPFLDPPDSRSIRAGYQMLVELGALEPNGNQHRLTPTGRRLSRLPVDPRLGRMVLEADRLGCVREVLVIAAALSIQDPRERPTEHRQAADELHARFRVEGSEFLSIVKLWDYVREQQQTMSSTQFRKRCRAEYLNWLRIREWQDLFSQLRQAAGQVDVRVGVGEGHPDRVHQALLAGLLSQIGMRDGETKEYRGAFGSRFVIGGTAGRAKRPPKWVMAGELVETNRLWARTVAAIQPEWAETVGAHLTKVSHDDPTWDAVQGRAVCVERVSLFGLPVVSGRRIGYDRVSVADAHDMFVRHALVEGDWETHHSFLADNLELVRHLEGTAQRVHRGVDLLEAAHRFYLERVPAEVVSGRHFDRWWSRRRNSEPALLTMTADALLGAADVLDPDAFPGEWWFADHVLPITYRFEPGAPDDGATVSIPVSVLNQIADEGFDWHVPGVRDEVIEHLLRGLPKEIRRELQPMADTVQQVQSVVRNADPNASSLAEAVSDAVAATRGVRIPGREVQKVELPAHLRIRFAAVDADGVELASARSVVELRRLMRRHVRAAVAAASGVDEARGLTAWTVGDLPATAERSQHGVVVRGHPTLVDEGDSVSLRVLTDPELAERAHRLGVRRLLVLAVPVSARAATARLSSTQQLAVAASALFVWRDLIADGHLAAITTVLDRGPVPRTAAEFEELRSVAAAEVADLTARTVAAAVGVIAAANDVTALLDRLVAPSLTESVDDARQHLARLVRPGFVAASGATRLADIERYVRGIERRLTKLPDDPARDRRLLHDVLQVEDLYRRRLAGLGSRPVPPELREVAWQLEEVRVGQFAQALAKKGAPSLAKVLATLQRQ